MDERPGPGLPNGDIKPAMIGRAWNGLSAKVCETPGGRVRPPSLVDHRVVMHLGPPISTTCRLADLIQRRISAPGDIDIVPSDADAYWDEDGPASILGIGLTPELVRTIAREMGLNPDAISIAPALQLRDPAIERIGWAIKAELEAEQPLGKLYAESLGSALAALLLKRNAPTNGHLPCVGRSSRRRLQDVIAYIRDNLSSELKLSELALIAGLSPSHFKSLFKQSTDMPVHQYVILCRVEHAVNMLLHGETSLSEVASFAGFSDQSHMARCMRRVIGLTPAQVRRQSG